MYSNKSLPLATIHRTGTEEKYKLFKLTKETVRHQNNSHSNLIFLKPQCELLLISTAGYYW